MGNILHCLLKFSGRKEFIKSSSIHIDNRKDHRIEEDKFKILLLGPGESGKSTILRQLQLLYGKPYDTSYQKKQITHVHKHILDSMKIMLQHTNHDQIQDQKAYELISTLSVSTSLDPTLGKLISSLWKEPSIQNTWNERHKIQIYDTAAYFFDQIDRIVLPDYIPTNEDMLHVRYRTNGVGKARFSIQGTVFEVYDVGGQRTERRKWVHCFDRVTAIIYVAAISEYDQVCYEDETQNRVKEAIDVFAEVCNNSVLQQPCLILFLNKKDAFEEKIKRKNISSIPIFSDYEGKVGDYQSGIEYFQQLFLLENRKRKRVYCHVTCAMDARHIRYTINACVHAITRENLDGAGFIA